MASTKLILLPGLEGEGVFFPKLIQALPEDISTRILPYPKEQIGYEALADLIEPQLKNEEAFVLLGESFGGPLAMMLAARELPQCKGLILLATFSEPPMPVWLIKTFTKLHPFLIRLPFARGLINSALFNGADKTMAEKVYAILKQTPSETIALRMRETAEVSLSSFLQKCNLPVLMMNARRDRIVWRNYPPLTILACPRLTLVAYNTSHALLEYVPQSAAEAISDFIKKLK